MKHKDRIERCSCDDFQAALQPCTDHERYGAAIISIGGEWQLGDTPALKFCPWCGKKVPEVTE